MSNTITSRSQLFLTIAVSVSLFATGVLAATESDNTAPAEIKLITRGHGWILTDAHGMTLYTYSKDPRSGSPLCVDECLETWLPLKVREDSQPTNDWSVVKRDDGTNQWAFRGKPLYTYSRDVSPADMNGDEYLQQWYVAVKHVPLPPGFDTYKTPDGYLLVDQENVTLYTSTADELGTSSCAGQCAKIWRPVEAWWRAQSTLDYWTVLDRDDGTKQWAYRGQPLYRFSGDFAPGDIAGNGMETWRAVILEPPPPVPDWITIQNSDAGPLLADSDGKTLYAYDLPEQRAFGTPFDIGTSRDMATPHLWIPVYGDSSTDPIGHWSLVELNDGRYQWTYKGLKLFIHKRDTEPGDLNGQRGTDRYWRTIMKDGKNMAGSGR